MFGAVGGPERALPVDAAVVEVGPVLELPARQVAALGDAGDVGALRPCARSTARRPAFAAIGDLASRACSTRRRRRPARRRRCRRSGRRCPCRSTRTRSPCASTKSEIIEVGRVLLAHARRAGDDQLAVPLVGQADDELRVVEPAVRRVRRRGVGEVAVDLQAGHAARVALADAGSATPSRSRRCGRTPAVPVVVMSSRQPSRCISAPGTLTFSWLGAARRACAGAHASSGRDQRGDDAVSPSPCT